ncbi:MAG: hypothetical protein WBP89_13030 [Sedimenticolaceae bacterium]
MKDDPAAAQALRSGPGLGPAEPLWRLVPTRADDGRSFADFMMLIPGLGTRPPQGRQRVTALIREVCESYGDQVAFADVNYAINVLWVSVSAEPGLVGRVAQAIRQQVPEALLVGGQLGAICAITPSGPRNRAWRHHLSGLSRRATRLLRGPQRG